MSLQQKPDPKGRIYEKMHAIILSQFRIRVWAKPDADLKRLEAAIRTALGGSADIDERVRFVANECPDINAIEMLDEDGSGSLAYNDWP